MGMIGLFIHKNKMIMKKIYITLSLVVALLLSGCDSFLDVVPVGQVIPTKTSEYRALMNSAYTTMPEHKQQLIMRGVQIDPVIDAFGLSGFPAYKNIYTWTDTSDEDGMTEEYKYDSFYKIIFYTNEIILHGPDAVDDGSEPIEQVIGEAYTLRAYSYFELANMYGPKYSPEAASTKVVPINVKIDTEQVLPKSTLGEIYALIESDLAEAEKRLQVTSWEEPQNKYRVSKEAFYALASRVYLYKGEWTKSLDYAKKALAINGELENFNNEEALLPTQFDSKENIWALEKVVGTSVRDYSTMKPEFITQYKDGDLRKDKFFETMTSWIDFSEYTVSSKFTSNKTRCTARRAEVYLNAAEAAARSNNDNAAKQYMGTLIDNRYSSEAAAEVKKELGTLSGEQLINIIFDERIKELAVEGHEWYDYKRTTQPALSKVVEGEEYHLQKNDPRYVLQIPKSAREANPKLQE